MRSSAFSGSCDETSTVNLAELVATSERVAATRSRNDKARFLAALLQRLAQDEVPFVVAALSGHARQGRIGVGYAAVRSALENEKGASEPAATQAAPTTEAAPLELVEVDRIFDALAETKGKGSAQ